MNPLKKIAGINLLVMFGYSALIRLVNGRGNEAALGIMILSAVAVGAHVLICLGASAFRYRDKNKPSGRAWLLSAGLVLLVGFSTCLGNASL